MVLLIPTNNLDTDGRPMFVNPREQPQVLAKFPVDLQAQARDAATACFDVNYDAPESGQTPINRQERYAPKQDHLEPIEPGVWEKLEEALQPLHDAARQSV